MPNNVCVLKERFHAVSPAPARGMRTLSQVAALGGGTGLPAVLRGLRQHLPWDCQIAAIVTAADDGGSSGVLRREYGVLPPGDIRNCLVALARVAPEVTAALQCRLAMASGVEHAVGNLLLTALDMVAADEIAAIRLAATLLRIEDIILPSTTTRVNLVASLADGRQITGESEIPRGGSRVLRVALDPPGATPAPGVLDALASADAIIVGPGSFYTSVLATVIVPQIAETIAAASGLKIFVCNIMTEPGETDGFGVAAHLDALRAHGLPPEAFDYVVLNEAPIPEKIRARYAALGAEPVRFDLTETIRPRIITADLLEHSPVVRHDPDKLGRLIADLAARPRQKRKPESRRRAPRDEKASRVPIAVRRSPLKAIVHAAPLT